MREIEKAWIEMGYRFFAFEGPSGLKIERLSKEISKNKSSFYHLFADIELFTERLLDFHLDQAKIMCDKEANAQSETELTQIILEHKLDLLFNRQLRIHRENPTFKVCFIKTNEISFPSLLPVWKRIIGLPENSSLAQMVLHLSLENFYLQITDEILTENWLTEYFSTIRQMVNHFKHFNAIKPIDGNV